MSIQIDEHLSAKLDRIGAALDQLVEIERGRAASAKEWRAEDLRLRQAQAQDQATLLEQGKQAQARQRRALLAMGVLAGMMLLVGIGLLTESWWLPAVVNGR